LLICARKNQLFSAFNMGKFIRLSKGFNINLKGKPANQVSDAGAPDTVAIKPDDFHGLYMPKVVVNVGDSVKAGTVLFHDKQNPEITFTAPVSGEVVEVLRGEKRKLLEIKILADRTTEFLGFKKFTVSELSSAPVKELKSQLLQSGVWANLVQRPYGIIANPEITPKAIHISAFDTAPAAPDYGVLFKGQDQFFQAGVDVLKRLTSGSVHINTHASLEVSTVFSQAKGAEINKFNGKHPASCVGVQIHHLTPINKGETVWTINPAGVIQIGKLFLNGVYDASRLVALTGPSAKTPQYYKTVTGASVKKIVDGNLTDNNSRIISGNILTGTKIGADGHLGFYDQQITAIPEGNYYEFLGWILPSAKKLSLSRAFGLFSFLKQSSEFAMDTNMHGEPRAFVQSGVFEKVTPMDIYPVHLLKAILANDIDEMEALGIYEVIEEDLALCEFADVSKHPVQAILREGLETMRTS
jgi:Na+-transporting NADH:ubiquinone oxidoreductase subunit A